MRAHELGQLGRVTNKIDNKIRKLRKRQALNPQPEGAVQEQLEHTLEIANNILNEQDSSLEDFSWNDYYRLMGRIAFAPELVIAPQLFSTNNFEHRAALADGTSGKAIEIVADALGQFNTGANDTYRKAELQGVINEYTPIGLINRRQDGISLALPSSLYSDLVRKVDHIYHSSDDFDTHFQTNIQAKSGLRMPSRHRHPQSAYVYASDFSNVGQRGTFPMSMLLVKELQGEMLTCGEDRRINFASMALERHIRGQRTKINTKYFRTTEVTCE